MGKPENFQTRFDPSNISQLQKTNPKAFAAIQDSILDPLESWLTSNLQVTQRTTIILTEISDCSDTPNQKSLINQTLTSTDLLIILTTTSNPLLTPAKPITATPCWRDSFTLRPNMIKFDINLKSLSKTPKNALFAQTIKELISAIGLSKSEFANWKNPSKNFAAYQPETMLRKLQINNTEILLLTTPKVVKFVRKFYEC
jgi:hypothetical protein